MWRGGQKGKLLLPQISESMSGRPQSPAFERLSDPRSCPWIVPLRQVWVTQIRMCRRCLSPRPQPWLLCSPGARPPSRAEEDTRREEGTAHPHFRECSGAQANDPRGSERTSPGSPELPGCKTAGLALDGHLITPSLKQMLKIRTRERWLTRQ